MGVNRKLLGILEQEEVVAAWSEAPRFTTEQEIAIFGGFFFAFVMPCIHAFVYNAPICFLEAIIAEFIHYRLIEYFILRRRPQAGFVLTSRRVFQVTRQPAYRDMFGMTEPMLKLDVLIHNCGIEYSSMTMEAYVPCWRRTLGRLFNVPVFRRGAMITQGAAGIFKLRRDIGDTREVFN